MRLVPYLDAAWKLIYGLLFSKKLICSTAWILFIMLYMFGCLGVEIITKDPELSDIPDFDMHFGSLPRVMLTLLQFVTLDSAASIYYPLMLRNPLLLLFFLPVIVIVSIALMN